MIGPGRLPLLALLLATLPAQSQQFHVYVGDLSHESAIIAWGRTDGSGNTIGRNSVPDGTAVVKVGDREFPSEKNWVHVRGLEPDRDYDYQVLVDGRAIGSGSLRTWPAASDKLAFFVIGDYGNGRSEQRRLAGALWREFLRRSRTDNPARFVLTTGDNLYGIGWGPFLFHSGNKDRHWGSRFFEPYRDLIRSIPFYPTLGNHDGDESESARDLAVYLDNFFFPGGNPARYYSFSFGGLAEFFGLDTTENRLENYPPPGYGESSEQTGWLRSALLRSKAPWKFAYFHHPPFSAGPEHPPSLNKLRHWVELFRTSGVAVVFTGHEHNLQFSARSDQTGDVLYVVTGSGGKLRGRDIRGRMKAAGIAGWAPQRHFLLVEIVERRMQITPMSDRPVEVVRSDGSTMEMPLIVNLATSR